jgi:hypothetical protein
MREVLNANPFAVRSIMTAPGVVVVGTVVVVTVVTGVPVGVVVGVVVRAVVTGMVIWVVIAVVGTVVTVAVGVAVGVTGPSVVHPAMIANTAAAMRSIVNIFLDCMNRITVWK